MARSARTPARYGTARRRSIRLKSYDYASSGAYFVTVCTAGHRPLLGRVSDGEMVENRNATILRGCWLDLPDHYPHVRLDAFVVMPDHLHGVIVLGDAHRTGISRDDVARAGLKPAPTGGGVSADLGGRRGLPEIVRALKTFSARRINATRNTPGGTIWQRGYYERVIRNGRELDLTREYIEANPYRWQRTREGATDKPNPS